MKIINDTFAEEMKVFKKKANSNFQEAFRNIHAIHLSTFRIETVKILNDVERFI